MNDLARGALVAAALRGHKQIQCSLHDHDEGGECALGVIHLAAHGGNREQALLCQRQADCAHMWGDLSAREGEDIARANDLKGWDFLTIARKIGVTESPA